MSAQRKSVQTVRSLTESTSRRKDKTDLLIGQGIAGRAFQTGQSQCSNDFNKSKDFFAVRGSYKEFYQSGISSPFKVNGEIHGVVNLDCERPVEFENRLYFLVQCVADLIGLLCQLQSIPNSVNKKTRRQTL